MSQKKIDMPEITAWVASLREAFGAEEINCQIRRGRDGEPVFFASENGASYGTPIPPGNPWNAAGIDDRLLTPVGPRKS